MQYKLCNENTKTADGKVKKSEVTIVIFLQKDITG